MKNVYLILFAIASISFTGIKAQNSNSWKLYSKIGDVSVYYAYEDCHLTSQGLHRQNINIKVENSSTTSKIVEWDYELFYDNVCKTCNNSEYHVKLSLKAGETKEGKCEMYDPLNLRIFVKHLDLPNKTVLTDFKLSNLKSN